MSIPGNARNASPTAARPAAFDPTLFWDWVARGIARLTGAATLDDASVRTGVRLVREEIASAESSHTLIPKLEQVITKVCQGIEHSTPASGGAVVDDAVFWGYARRFMTSRIRGERVDQEGLVQEALIRLSRQFGRMHERGEELQNPEALMTTIAKATAADAFRDPHLTRTTAISNDAPGAEIEDPSPRMSMSDEQFELAYFTVREYLRGRFERPSCLEIWDRNEAGKTQEEIGREFQQSREAIAKRWSRCYQEARTMLAQMAGGWS